MTKRRRQRHLEQTPPESATLEQAPPESATTAAATQPRRGRPPGSRNLARVLVAVRVAACPACKSTDRTPYTDKPLTADRPGNLDGQPYTHIVYRDCRCLNCGKPRREIHFENHPTTDQEPADQ